MHAFAKRLNPRALLPRKLHISSCRAQSVETIQRTMDWAALGDLLKSSQIEQGVEVDVDLVNGPPSPFSVKRLFGRPEADVRVKLYRDHAAWCPYCQRVWLMLEEKQIPYVMEKINMRCYGDKPADFLKKVPSGLLPVIELDGRVITESVDIMNILERVRANGSSAELSVVVEANLQTFTDKPMLPSDRRSLETANALLRLERDMFGLWCRWTFRPLDDRGEARAQSVFEEGLKMVDDALGADSSGPFFLGEISMVDLMWAPFLERYNASLLYWKGFKLRNGSWPNIDRWFEALEARATYAATQSDHYTHCHDIPPQYGPGYAANDTVAFAKAINGTDGVSWRLPLPPLDATSFEPRSNVTHEDAHYKVLAATKLVSNHVAVTRFALRGVGTPGKHFSAALADPYAKPNLDYEPQVSYALRLTTLALLSSPESAASAASAEQWLGAQVQEKQSSAAAVVTSLSYLRDRVGVPRDMQLPAARQLRAHLNWCIDLAQALAAAAVDGRKTPGTGVA